VAGHFGIKTAVCINKYDLNPAGSGQIEALCEERAVIVAGRLPFHSSVVEAMVSSRSVVELGGPVAQAISEMWNNLEELL
jgi:MinD superfamily P-loop ATPase